MKKLSVLCGFHRWVATVLVVAALLLPVATSCRHQSPQRHDERYARLDSMMSTINDVDTLAAMAQQFHAQHDAVGEMIALKFQGTRLRKQSLFDEAIGVHRQGLAVATHAADTLEMIAACNNIGTDYRRMGNLSAANGYHFQALKLCDTYSDKESEQAIKSYVMSLNGIGNIEVELRNHDTADSIFRQALQGEKKLGSNLGMAINYANIGAVKRGLGERDSAWFYYRKSLEYNQLAGSQEGEALCHLHFGELYRDERSLSRAQQEYEIAYDKLKQLGETYHWLECCLPLASLCILLDEKDDARRYLKEAETEALRINSKEHQADAYWIRYELALNEGDTRQALDYYVKSKELYDSIYGLEKNKEMRHQRINYEKEIKSGEVITLNNNIMRLKRARNMMGVLGLLLFLMAAAIIVALVYAMRVRNRTQRMLRQVEETRSLFFTNVVHQLRTPLTAIMGATDDIVASGAKEPGDNQRKDVEIIERQGKNLLMLVDRILEVGGVRSALRDPEWRTGDAVTFVRMVVESYRDHCVERHIELTYLPQELNVDIDIVPRYLSTILGSLLENAINYSKDFSKISVTTLTVDGQFVIKVIDNGIGISQADLPHVFEPFYRGAVAEHLVDGVGIGLTVVRDMTMAMNGTVEATSVKDNGSCFTVRLPIKHGNGVKERLEYVMEPIASLTHRRRQSTQDPGPDATNQQSSLPLVLVVEDHADVAHLVGRVLRESCSVAYASNGMQALTKMNQQPPDLIITDVKMPQMDGYELCRKVRSSSKLCMIPIIMLSARNNDADRVKGIEAGADAYLVKPFVREELQAWVDRMLERNHMGRAALERMVQERVDQPKPAVAAATPAAADAKFIQRFNKAVEDLLDAGEKLDYDKIALSFKMGESQMRRMIQEETGKNLAAHVMQLRMERAMRLLKSRPDLRIGDVAEQCGFLDVAYFSRVFRQYYGKTPTQARNM